LPLPLFPQTEKRQRNKQTSKEANTQANQENRGTTKTKQNKTK